MRIVSLLPSATEIPFALGCGDDVVGVTHECDHPPEARSRRIVSTSAVPDGATIGAVGAAESARQVDAQGVLPPGAEVWAIGADAIVVRNGSRIVDGVEVIASILHPDRCGRADPTRALRIA